MWSVWVDSCCVWGYLRGGVNGGNGRKGTGGADVMYSGVSVQRFGADVQVAPRGGGGGEVLYFMCFYLIQIFQLLFTVCIVRQKEELISRN